jgi:hypothetical protein
MKLVLSFLLVSLSFISFSQSKVTLSGYITDSNDGEAMTDVKVYIPALKLGAMSNSYGFYSLTVAPGKYAVEFRSIAYGSEVKEIDLTKSQVFSTELGSKVTNVNEVVVNMKKRRM